MSPLFHRLGSHLTQKLIGVKPVLFKFPKTLHIAPNVNFLFFGEAKVKMFSFAVGFIGIISSQITY